MGLRRHTSAPAPSSAPRLGSPAWPAGRIRRYRRQLAAARHKPMRVILFRLAQEQRLLALETTGGWAKIATRARRAPLEPASSGWIPASAPDLLRSTAGPDESSRLPFGTVDVLGDAIDLTEPIDWHSDWRHPHRWSPAPFRSYDFYSPLARPEPYDIRIVWELNRLGFLPALAHRAGEPGTPDGRELLEAVVTDWTASNPLAMSASWQSMEASMRLVALATTVSCLAVADALDDRSRRLLLPLIVEHGEFVWRTREFTDVRGNHYAANLVALLLAGQLLSGCYGPARRWHRFARRHLADEIAHQLQPDGSSIEGSLCYHRLTVHLFLIARAALRNDGGLPPTAEERLRSAAALLASAVGRNGRLPAVGDGDDAVAVRFTLDAEPDWWTPVAMAAAAWPGSIPRPPGWMATTGAIWSTGVDPDGLRWAPTDVRSHHPDAGWVFVRDAHSSFHADIGPVGMQGRGGHGHNDQLSFGLELTDRPLFVDPGSYCYTGDMAARDQLRSTAGHNSLTIDDAEIAELLGPWRIAPDAVPIDPRVDLDRPPFRVACGTTGYQRLADPVAVRRQVTWASGRDGGELVIDDAVDGSTALHTVQRYLHLAPGWAVEVRSPTELSCRSGPWTATVTCDGRSALTHRGGFVTTGYGRRRAAPVLVATTPAVPSGRLRLEVRVSRHADGGDRDHDRA